MTVKMKRAACVALLATVGGASAYAALSEPVVVDCGYRNTHWCTLHTNEVALSWQWPSGAESASLQVSGMNTAFVTNFNADTSSYVWRVFSAGQAVVEEAFELVLTHYYPGGAVAAAMTSRVAVVEGAFGGARVRPSADSLAWSRVRKDTVLAYDASWANNAEQASSARLVIDKAGGPSQTNAFEGVCGYYGWKLVGSGWGYGVFSLLVQFPETEGQLAAELTRLPDGTMVLAQ